MAVHEASLPLAKRLWIYQAERFPLAKTAPLIAAFSAASISVSAHLAGRPLPGWGAFAVAFTVTMILFFEMRACDEVKDAEDDRRFRPERPVPRGLVTLNLIVGFGIAGFLATLVIVTCYAPALLWPLMLVQAWLALMTVEFFAPDWLRERPFLYLLSHMAIMPLIDLFLTACEWLPAAGSPPPGLWVFLALSFVNGCVIEIGRKLYALENERAGVETYSALMGPQRAATLWAACVALSFCLLLATGFAVGSPLLVGVIGAVALGLPLVSAAKYAKAATPKSQKTMDAVSGVWVLVCYAAAGFAPFLSGGAE
jgi:4-hydroxybenzoate polyprenyltransferase